VIEALVRPYFGRIGEITDRVVGVTAVGLGLTGTEGTRSISQTVEIVVRRTPVSREEIIGDRCDVGGQNPGSQRIGGRRGVQRDRGRRNPTKTVSGATP